MGQAATGCMHCAGMRCPCTCEADCGSRPPLTGTYCPKADGYVDWLRGTGLYSEAELAEIAAR